MNLFPSSRVHARVSSIAALRAVHEAFQWIHLHAKTIFDWQVEMVAIPAPPFGETARGEWIAERFREIGLSGVRIDEVGNVVGMFFPADYPEDCTGPVVVLSAHLDTVFPAETELKPKVDGELIEAPGVCDNCAGLAALLALGKALAHAQVPLAAPVCLLANVGEEGEGDLRGVRHFYRENRLAGRVAAHIVLDGAGAEPAVTQALGSRRFLVTLRGPGGHSFTDAGTPNPIAALSAALTTLWQSPLPEEPLTTRNIGAIHGGASVNAIPESVAASIDFRSTHPDCLARQEWLLRQAVTEAVEAANAKVRGNATLENRLLSFEIQLIGERPAGHLPEDSPLLSHLRAVDRHLTLQTEARLGSTDANLPLSLGVPALSLGAGGDGGGAHTLAEWYSAKDRELGLRRILLLLLAMADWAATL